MNKPQNKTTPNPGQIGAAKEDSSETDFNTSAAFLEVLTRIATALENQNHGLECLSNRIEDFGGWVSAGLADVASSRKGGRK